MIYFVFSILRVRVRVIPQSHCHKSVTSDDMVTVMITSHKITEKDIKGSEKDDTIQYVVYMVI